MENNPLSIIPVLSCSYSAGVVTQNATPAVELATEPQTGRRPSVRKKKTLGRKDRARGVFSTSLSEMPQGRVSFRSALLNSPLGFLPLLSFSAATNFNG
ncbi:hypothetical protein SKAU_G00409780 [Synaphobranchus kaupii]|uniref:Uncharacterized protein n=1 Tax=Synaphobranchus kaupii TaxID=118154 RepID=A0A9Q1IBK9_SYNKA|nr:hypothetical protein SKAU_G00409780 [Synaphobranchus kaupii]